jgi:hypothetical protein
MDGSHDLISQVRDEIGLDAYYLYPDTRRMIPDPVIWGFASACVLKFAEGLGIDFKQFGEQTKCLLSGLVDRIFRKQDFEPFVENEQLPAGVALAIVAIPERIDEHKRAEGVRRLEAALTELGMPAPTASERDSGAGLQQVFD